MTSPTTEEIPTERTTPSLDEVRQAVRTIAAFAKAGEGDVNTREFAEKMGLGLVLGASSDILGKPPGMFGVMLGQPINCMAGLHTLFSGIPDMDHKIAFLVSEIQILRRKDPLTTMQILANLI